MRILAKVSARRGGRGRCLVGQVCARENQLRPTVIANRRSIASRRDEDGGTDADATTRPAPGDQQRGGSDFRGGTLDTSRPAVVERTCDHPATFRCRGDRKQ